MKLYNIDRAKDLNDQLDATKQARGKLGQASVIYMLIRVNGDTLVIRDALVPISSAADTLIPISVAQAGSILDDKESDLKKRLSAIGVEID